MRIAIVTETFLPSVDGVVTRLRHGVEHATSQGHEVLVIAPDLGVREHAEARVVGMPAVTLPFYRERPFALPSRRVQSVLDDFAPDVVHAAQPLLLASSGALGAHRRGIPLVASYHTHIPRYLDLYPAWRWGRPLLWRHIRRRHALADVNLATSAAMAQELSAHGIEHLRVLRRGVDTEAFGKSRGTPEMRRRLSGGREHRTLLVYVGRLAAEKEIATLLPLARREDIALAVIGDGPERAALEAAFAGTGTCFLGFLSGEDLAEAFASADAFVFPSVTETLGLVIAEAMASGLPVVAARSGPTIEQVSDGEDGLLYDRGDEQSLLSAVDRLGEVGAVGRMGRAARARAEALSWEAASADLLDAYAEAIARRAGRAASA